MAEVGRAVCVVVGEVHDFVFFLAGGVVLLVGVLLDLLPEVLLAHVEVPHPDRCRLPQGFKLVQLGADLQGDALVVRSKQEAVFCQD